MRGHVVVTAAIYLRCDDPMGNRTLDPKAQAGSKYRKLTQIAVDMIKRFPKLGNTKVRVLFDAAYLAVHSTKACQSRDFTGSPLPLETEICFLDLSFERDGGQRNLPTTRKEKTNQETGAGSASLPRSSHSSEAKSWLALDANCFGCWSPWQNR